MPGLSIPVSASPLNFHPHPYLIVIKCNTFSQNVQPEYGLLQCCNLAHVGIDNLVHGGTDNMCHDLVYYNVVIWPLRLDIL